MAALTAAMNAFLSNEPACWASMVSTFAALAWPGRSSVGASAASCASLAFDGRRRMRLLVLGEAGLTWPVTCVKAGSSLGPHLGRRRPAVAAAGRRTAAPGRPSLRRPPAAPAAPQRRHRSRRPCRHRRPVWRGFAPALPSGCTAGTGFGGGTGFFAGTASGPKPVLVTASAEAGGFGPFQLDGHAGGLRRLEPLLDRLDRRVVAANLDQRGVDLGDRRLARATSTGPPSAR